MRSLLPQPGGFADRLTRHSLEPGSESRTPAVGGTAAATARSAERHRSSFADSPARASDRACARAATLQILSPAADSTVIEADASGIDRIGRTARLSPGPDPR